MNYFNKIILVTIFSFFEIAVAAEEITFHMKWGGGSEFHHEISAPKGSNAAYMAPAVEGEVLYRYFSVEKYSDAHTSLTLDLLKRHDRLWKQYHKFVKKEGFEGLDHREEFFEYVRVVDNFYPGATKRLAPSLYFDFIGVQQKEYVLEAIEVETLDFDEYSGGGFYDKESWYDILISPTVGVKRYDVSKKLRFNGSGRTQLRLFSDNYYPLAGLTPMGCFMLDIKFIFFVDGKRESISTGAFKVDL